MNFFPNPDFSLCTTCDYDDVAIWWTVVKWTPAGSTSSWLYQLKRMNTTLNKSNLTWIFSNRFWRAQTYRFVWKTIVPVLPFITWAKNLRDFDDQNRYSVDTIKRPISKLPHKTSKTGHHAPHGTSVPQPIDVSSRRQGTGRRRSGWTSRDGCRCRSAWWGWNRAITSSSHQTNGSSYYNTR